MTMKEPKIESKIERKNRWQPAIDYRKLRLHNLTSGEFRHLLLLLYWPVYGLLFMFVERFYAVDHYTAMYCPLDDLIPFCEWFVIPYLFWFVLFQLPVGEAAKEFFNKGHWLHLINQIREKLPETDIITLLYDTPKKKVRQTRRMILAAFCMNFL